MVVKKSSRTSSYKSSSDTFAHPISNEFQRRMERRDSESIAPSPVPTPKSRRQVVNDDDDEFDSFFQLRLERQHAHEIVDDLTMGLLSSPAGDKKQQRRQSSTRFHGIVDPRTPSGSKRSVVSGKRHSMNRDIDLGDANKKAIMQQTMQKQGKRHSDDDDDDDDELNEILDNAYTTDIDEDDELAQIMNATLTSQEEDTEDEKEQRQNLDDSSLHYESFDNREDISDSGRGSSNSNGVDRDSIAGSDLVLYDDIVKEQNDQALTRLDDKSLGDTKRSIGDSPESVSRNTFPTSAFPTFSKVDGCEQKESMTTEDGLVRTISEASSIDSHSPPPTPVEDTIVALEEHGKEEDDETPQVKINAVDTTRDEERTVDKIITPIISSHGLKLTSMNNEPTDGTDSQIDRDQEKRTFHQTVSQTNDVDAKKEASETSPEATDSSSLAQSQSSVENDHVISTHDELVNEKKTEKEKKKKRRGIIHAIGNIFQSLNCRKRASSASDLKSTENVKPDEMTDREQQIENTQEDEPEKARMIDEYLAEELMNEETDAPTFIRASELLIVARTLMEEANVKQKTNPAEAKALTTTAHTYGYVSRQLTKDGLLERQARHDAKKQREAALVSESIPEAITDDAYVDSVIEAQSTAYDLENTKETKKQERSWFGDISKCSIDEVLPSCFTTCGPLKSQEKSIDVEETLVILAKISEDDPKDFSTHSRSKSSHALLKEWMSAEQSRREERMTSNFSSFETHDSLEHQNEESHHSTQFLSKDIDIEETKKGSFETKKSIGNQSVATKNTVGNQSVGTAFMMDLVDNIRTFYNADMDFSLSTGFSNEKDDDDDLVLALPFMPPKRNEVKTYATSGIKSKNDTPTDDSVLVSSKGRRNDREDKIDEIPEEIIPESNANPQSESDSPSTTNVPSKKSSKWRFLRNRK